MGALQRLVEYAKLASQVSRARGVPAWTQLSEMVRLGRRPARLGPGDYYVYGLFGRDIDWAEKRRFVGWRSEAVLDALNDVRWHALALDKILMYAVLAHNGIRVPHTRAIYHAAKPRLLAGAQPLTGPDELRAWLSDDANYPHFAKPSAGGFGRGAFLAQGLAPSGAGVRLADGTVLTLDELVARLDDREQLGYLFQTPLEADPRLLPRLGAIVSSLRFMVLVDERDAPEVHRAFWKLPTGSNMQDNYNGGVTGNLAAAVDLQSGRITRVIRGVGPTIAEVDTHPDTGQPLRGIEVPDWPEVQAFVLHAALAFPKLRFQQWDVALTADGPVALEVNLYGTGGCDLTQLLGRRGLRDERMEAFLRRHPRS